MKLTIPKSAILKGIQTVQRAVPVKSPMPNLQSVLLSAQDNSLAFAATDMELGIRCRQSAVIEEEGDMLLPARLFFEIIRRMPDDIITCESVGRSLVLRYGDADFTLNGYDPEEYPVIKGFPGTTACTLPGNLLKKMIHQVTYACKHNDEKGGVFSGILMETENNQLTLVATDTHRLSMNTGALSSTEEPSEEISQEVQSQNIQRWIVPGKAVMELGRLINGEEEIIIERHKESSRLSFKFNDTEVITRLMSGQFPNYRQVIPSVFSTKMVFDRVELLEAVERANLLSLDTQLKTSIVRLHFAEQNISINQASEMGKIYEQIPVEHEGEDMMVTFNVSYIIDTLKSFNTERVSMVTAGPYSPCLFRPLDSDEEHYIGLVLPLRH